MVTVTLNPSIHRTCSAERVMPPGKLGAGERPNKAATTRTQRAHPAGPRTVPHSGRWTPNPGPSGTRSSRRTLILRGPENGCHMVLTQPPQMEPG